ncbi:MAG: sulfatase [Acidobacteriota bacterium]
MSSTQWLRGCIAAMFTSGLALTVGAILASQVITRGQHPFVSDPTLATVLPSAGAAFVASLPLAIVVGLLATDLGPMWRGLLLGFLVIAVTFTGLRQNAVGDPPTLNIESIPYLSEEALESSTPDKSSDSPPHIVLITIDTLRWDHVGFAGYTRPVTPRLDELASRGTVYAHAIAQAPATNSSMASMSTGLYPHVIEYERKEREGAGAFVAEGLHMIAERLALGGYETAAFVSNPYLKANNGFAQGFEHFDEDTGMFRSIGNARQHNASHLVDATLAWLDERSSDRPLFLWLHILDPHHPYEPAEPAPWENPNAQPFRSFAAEYDAMSVREMTDHFQALSQDDGALRPGELDYLIGRYDGEILQSDREVGRLLDHLDQIGFSPSNTLYMVTSDHGEEFFDRGGMLHSHHLHDELIRVPLIVAGPGFAAEVEEERQARLIDLAPTMMVAAGLPMEGFDGVALQHDEPTPHALSFRGLGEVSLRTFDHKLYAEYHTRFWYICRTGNPYTDLHRLFVARYGRGLWRPERQPEVYDLVNDPGETSALTDEATINRLFCQLADELEQHPPRLIAGRTSSNGLSADDIEHLRNLGYVE